MQFRQGSRICFKIHSFLIEPRIFLHIFYAIYIYIYIYIKDVPKVKLDKSLRANLFNKTTLTVILPASGTWSTTKKEKQRLVTAIERSLLGISLPKHTRSEVIREKSGVQDMITEYWKQKCCWARHIWFTETGELL